MPCTAAPGEDASKNQPCAKPFPSHSVPSQSSIHAFTHPPLPCLAFPCLWPPFPAPPAYSGKPMLLTTGEKERIFTDAIQSFYYNQRQMLDDDDFDKLKEDLAWEGSPVSEGRGVGRGGRARSRAVFGRVGQGSARGGGEGG